MDRMKKAQEIALQTKLDFRIAVVVACNYPDVQVEQVRWAVARAGMLHNNFISDFFSSLNQIMREYHESGNHPSRHFD